MIINQQLQAFIPQFTIKAEFLRCIVLISRSYFELTGTAATLTYVNQQGFENLPIPLPKVEEQLEIVEFLDAEIRRIETLVGRVELVINLLKERRSALITAAVTGQIDVRKLIPEVPV